MEGGMNDNLAFQLLRLVVENISIWKIVGLCVLIWLWRDRAAVKQALMELPKYVSKFKIGDLEVELRAVQQDLKLAKEQIDSLENDLEQERARMQDIVTGFDAHAPVLDLAPVREAVKAMAPSMKDMDVVWKGLAEGATANQVYVAAEVLRARRDIRFFDALVSCLDRLAADSDPHGVRLHTVWTLTSALHKILISDIKPHDVPRLRLDQLQSAQKMLDRLVVNAHVLEDKPDAPDGEVRGPAKWASGWIDRGIRKIGAAAPEA